MLYHLAAKFLVKCGVFEPLLPTVAITPGKSFYCGEFLSFRRCLAAILILLALTAPAVDAQQFSFRNYQEEDGLENLTVRCLGEDRQGTLWIGTDNGLYRYDGVHFEAEKLPRIGVDVQVSGITEDGAGHLWISTMAGLFLKKEAKPESPWIKMDDHEISLDSDQGQHLRLTAAGEVLLVNTDHVLIRVYSTDAGKSWQAKPYFTSAQIGKMPEGGAIGAIYAVADGGLWFACGRVLCRSRNGLVEVWDEDEGVPREHWSALLIDHTGTLWARGLARAVVLEPGANHFLPRDVAGPAVTMQPDTIDLIEDPWHAVLTRTETGIARWNGHAWERFDRSNGLPPAVWRSMLFDRDGELWIGTSGHGLYRWLGYGNLRQWTEAEGLPGSVVWYERRDDMGALWIATSKGLAVLPPGGHHLLPVLKPGDGPAAPIFSLAGTTDGSTWAVSGGQVLRYRSAAARPQILRSDTNKMTLLNSRSGNLYLFSKNETEQVIVAGKAENSIRVGPGFPGRQLPGQTLSDPSGNSWFVSTSGIYRLNDGQWIALSRGDHEPFEHPTQGAFAPDGTLWLDDVHGLVHYRLSGDVAVPLETVDPDILGSNYLMFVRFDNRGWLWAGNDRGVAINDGHRWTRFDRSNGLIWNDTDGSAFLAEPGGSVWIGTSGGLTEIQHPELLTATLLPEPRILSAKVGDNPITLNLGPRIAAGSGSLSLKLGTAGGFELDRQLRFEYRLLGMDEAWVSSGDNRLHFSSLQPGRYLLEVRSRSALLTGQFSPSVHWAFTVTPQWWRSIWALMAYALMLAAAVWMLLRWRLQVLILQRANLEYMVATRTAELNSRNQELTTARAALERRATHDELTGLLNRGAIMEKLRSQMEESARLGKTFAVVLVDIDHFKLINDTHGHLAGDAMLRGVAHALAGAMREQDRCGRWGGEEFMLLIPEVSAKQPWDRLEQLCRNIEARLVESPGGALLRATASFGVAWQYPGAPLDCETLLQRADEALYCAKHHGRNRVCYSGIPEQAGETLGIA